MNQETLARWLGVSVSTVSRLRSGKRVPTWPVMLAVRDTFGWSVADQATSRDQGTWRDDFESRLRQFEADDAARREAAGAPSTAIPSQTSPGEQPGTNATTATSG